MRYMMLDIRCVNTCLGLLRADYSSPDQGEVREEAEIARLSVCHTLINSQSPPSSVIIIQVGAEIVCLTGTMSI